MSDTPGITPDETPAADAAPAPEAAAPEAAAPEAVRAPEPTPAAEATSADTQQTLPVPPAQSGSPTMPTGVAAPAKFLRASSKTRSVA